MEAKLSFLAAPLSASFTGKLSGSPALMGGSSAFSTFVLVFCINVSTVEQIVNGATAVCYFKFAATFNALVYSDALLRILSISNDKSPCNRCSNASCSVL